MTENEIASKLYADLAQTIAPSTITRSRWSTRSSTLRNGYCIRRPCVILTIGDDEGEIVMEVAKGANMMEMTATGLLGATLLGVYVMPDPLQKAAPDDAARLRAAHAVRIMRELCTLFSASPDGDVAPYELCADL